MNDCDCPCSCDCGERDDPHIQNLWFWWDKDTTPDQT